MYKVEELARYIIALSWKHKRPIIYMDVNAILLLSFRDYYLKTGNLLFKSEGIGTGFMHYINESWFKFGIFGGSAITLPSSYYENIITLNEDAKQLIENYIYKENAISIPKDYSHLRRQSIEYFKYLPEKDCYSTEDLTFYIDIIENQKLCINKDINIETAKKLKLK